MTLPQNQIRAIKSKYGSDAANSTFVRNARSMKEAEHRAKIEIQRQHGVSFISPTDVVELSKGGLGGKPSGKLVVPKHTVQEMAAQKGIVSEFDNAFKRNLQEKVRMEKAKGNTGITSAQFDTALKKSEAEARKKIIVGR